MFPILLTVSVALLSSCDARAPAIFVNHGAGSRSWFGRDSSDNAGVINDWEVNVRGALLANRPRAIILVNCHYEESVITIARYDAALPLERELGAGYVVSISNTYSHPDGLEYPSRGSLEVADKLANALSAAGIKTAFSNDRGFDHGAFNYFNE
jgi:aromatic ring-opening dioxygenase catalytic subunit (LigB family)